MLGYHGATTTAATEIAAHKHTYKFEAPRRRSGIYGGTGRRCRSLGGQTGYSRRNGLGSLPHASEVGIPETRSAILGLLSILYKGGLAPADPGEKLGNQPLSLMFCREEFVISRGPIRRRLVLEDVSY